MPTTLPPSPRDFEIHRLALVEFLSTRRLAEKYTISQTRVRQIIARVADWLTEMLPLKSEHDIEKEKRYALHLAAAQLQHQIQELKHYWDGSGDPKYLRQQTRAIQALARLGAASHTLDSLADQTSESALQPSRSDLDPQSADSTTTTSAAANENRHSPAPNADLAPATSNRSCLNPPSEDCSPPSPLPSPAEPDDSPAFAATPCEETDLWLTPENARDTLKGLDIVERNLLTYIGQIPLQETERLASLNETLAGIRQSRANFMLRLSPDSPVLPVSVSSTAVSQQPSAAST